MTNNSFVFFLFSFFFLHGLSAKLEFPIGGRITIPFPPAYKNDFTASAIFLGSDDHRMKEPSFKSALLVEAIDGKFTCSLVVFLGDVKVWASDHLSKFWAQGGCVADLIKEGDLQVKDWTGRIGWRAGTSGLGVEALKLQKNSGNLILTTAENQIKWQSFDFPTDRLLWSQQLNTVTRLTSFPSPSSAFYYSLEIHSNHLGLYLNFEDQKYSYWEITPLSNSSISFIRLGSRGLKIFNYNSKKVGQIIATGDEAIRFLALEKTGNVKFYHSKNHDSRVIFKSSYQAINENESCNLPVPCGLSKICARSIDTKCWDLPRKQGDYSRLCNGNYSFDMDMVELKGVDTILRVQSPRADLTKDECARSCLNECKCVAAWYSEKMCSHYGLIAGAREVERGNESSYWLKVAKDRDRQHGISSSDLNKILIAGEVVNVLAVLLILGGFLYCFLKTRMRSENAGGDHH